MRVRAEIRQTARGGPSTRLGLWGCGEGVTEETYCSYGELLGRLLLEGRVRALITVLEGGYGDNLRRGIRVYSEALIGLRRCRRVGGRAPPSSVVRGLNAVVSRYWDFEVA